METFEFWGIGVLVSCLVAGIYLPLSFRKREEEGEIGGVGIDEQLWWYLIAFVTSLIWFIALAYLIGYGIARLIRKLFGKWLP